MSVDVLPDVNRLKDEISGVSGLLAAYLSQVFIHNHGYPGRTFYGEAFSILLWGCYHGKFERNISEALECYAVKNKTDPEYHWEFNNYALLSYRKRTNDGRVDRFLKPLHFKGTCATNWTLLRSAARFAAGQQRIKGVAEVIRRLRRYQLPSGLILDENNVKSFQYHCFSAALLAEMSNYWVAGLLRKPFLKAVDFICHFILPNGDTMYIGRGQQQIKGYGALLYILAEAYRITRRSAYLADLVRVWGHIRKFRLDDNSFPIVFNGVKKEFPAVIDAGQAHYAGWYPYNNYFDYLPLFGYLLVRTAESLAYIPECVAVPLPCNHKSDYSDDNYRVTANDGYAAVVSVPGGYWTNDMPFPYVCLNGKSIFPCYGGEQFQPSIYSMEGIPLPWGVRGGKPVYFRKELGYRFVGEELLGRGKLGIHRRKFRFNEKGFEIADCIELSKDARLDDIYVIHYLFFNVVPIGNHVFDISNCEQKIRITFSLPCFVSDKIYYCASGKLYAVCCKEKVVGRAMSRTANTKVEWE